MAAATLEPQCVTNSVFDDDEYTFLAGISDAWQLSWTTYSTVGYGVISASTSAVFLDNIDERSMDKHCALMNIILSFESLIGILAVSFAGAIIFGKLMQFQCDAKVKFSSIVVVTYGPGLLEKKMKDDNDLGCPELVFRIVNLLHDNQFGDVIGAELHTVATVHKNNSIIQQQTSNDQFSNALQSTRNLMEGINNRRSYFTPQMPQFKRQKIIEQNTHPDERPLPNSPSKASTSNKRGMRKKFQNFLSVKQQHGYNHSEMLVHSRSLVIVDQEKEVEMPNLVFEKLDLFPSNHPCFNTSWIVKHTLNEFSPLVKKEVRNKIRDGMWPSNLNTEDGVKESIDFDQLLVSFKGMSKATGTDVYAHKVYKMDNLEFGRKFESILQRKSNGGIGVISDDIDKTKPQ